MSVNVCYLCLKSIHEEGVINPLRRRRKGGDGQGGFGGDGRGGADLGGFRRLGGQHFVRVDIADILTGGHDVHDIRVIQKLFADFAKNEGGFGTVIIEPRAVQPCQRRAIGVIVEHGGVGERQGRNDDIALAGVLFPRQAGLFGVAAHDTAAQHLDGTFVVAGAIIDDPHLTIGVGVVGVDLERAVGIARGCHGFTHADVSVGDRHVGDGVVDAELIVEPGGFGEVFEGGFVAGFVELSEIAVEHADAVVEKSEIGSDIGGFLVPLDSQVVFAEHFVDVSLDAADIHQVFTAILPGLRDVVIGLLVLELVHQDLGVIGFGEQVVIVQLDGDEGFGLCLVAVFGAVGIGQVGV